MCSDVLAHLRDDHRLFERLFLAIEHECLKVENGQAADIKRLRAIATHLGAGAVPLHHGVEDAIFSQIVKIFPRFRKDIFDLLEDHQASKREFANFACAVDRGDEDFVDAARSFVANERGHFIAKEEIIFPYATKYLSAEQWQSLADILVERKGATALHSSSHESIEDLLV